MTNTLNTCKITILLLLLMLLLSCKTRKDLLYFQDIKDKEVLNIPGSSPDYRIRTDDNLYVNIQTINSAISQVFNPEQYSSVTGGNASAENPKINEYFVDTSGAITISGLGAVTVAGKTALEAQTHIQELANVYLKGASVQVKVLSFKITVLGELRNPGIFYNFNRNITILEAIGMAGGMTENAMIKELLVIRRTPTGSKSYRLDLSEKKLFASEAYFLQPNDVIYVNADRLKNFRLNATTFTFVLSGLTTILLALQYFRY
jgi:polysaccharide export outer membrane protein